jgi:hypothetical protein
MDAQKRLMLDLVKGSIPASTPLTISTQMEVLQLLGIVNEPKFVELIGKLGKLTPTGTPATLHNLIHLLSHLMRMSDRATSDHHETIIAGLSALNAIPDVALTFGTFMAICEELMESHHRHQSQSK